MWFIFPQLKILFFIVCMWLNIINIILQLNYCQKQKIISKYWEKKKSSKKLDRLFYLFTYSKAASFNFSKNNCGSSQRRKEVKESIIEFNVLRDSLVWRTNKLEWETIKVLIENITKKNAHWFLIKSIHTLCLSK
jgi:hypothetical protein